MPNSRPSVHWNAFASSVSFSVTGIRNRSWSAMSAPANVVPKWPVRMSFIDSRYWMTKGSSRWNWARLAASTAAGMGLSPASSRRGSPGIANTSAKTPSVTIRPIGMAASMRRRMKRVT